VLASHPIHRAMQHFLQGALSRGLVKRDVRQWLTVQDLVRAGLEDGWPESELWDAVIAVLATTHDQQSALRGLVRELSTLQASEARAASTASRRPRARIGAALHGLRRLLRPVLRPVLQVGRWHRRGLVTGLVLLGLLYGEKRVRELPRPVPQPELCLPPAVQKPTPESTWVMRPLPLDREAAMPRSIVQPLSILEPGDLGWGFGVWGLGVPLVLCVLGAGLLLAYPSTLRRWQAKRKKDQLTQAQYAQLEEEAYRVGLHLRPDYRVELAPPVKMSVLEDTATLLGRIYHTSRGRQLDPGATLAATLRHGGLLQPVMQPGRRMADLLVLYDEFDTRPYVPSFLKLISAWQRLGVRVALWSFQKTPQELTAADGRQKVNLLDLLVQNADSPLVLFASHLHIRGGDTYERWEQVLQLASVRAWLDPDPRPLRDRDGAEQQAIRHLSPLLTRFCLTERGLTALARFLQQRGVGVEVPAWESLEGPKHPEAIRMWVALGAQVPDSSWDQFEAMRQALLSDLLPDPRSMGSLIAWFAGTLGRGFRPYEATIELAPTERAAHEKWLRDHHPARSQAGYALLEHALDEDEASAPSPSQSVPRNLAMWERIKRRVVYRAKQEPTAEAAADLLQRELGSSPLRLEVPELVAQTCAVYGRKSPGGDGQTLRPALDRRFALQTAASTACLAVVVLLLPRFVLRQGHDWLAGRGARSVQAEGQQPVQDYALEKADVFAKSDFRPALHPIPAGTFTMGSPASESGRDADEVLHEVAIKTSFLMMETEVTQDQYAALMGENPSEVRKQVWPGFESIAGSGHGQPCKADGVGRELPVFCVDFFDAVAYANRLSQKEGLEPCYTLREKDVDWPKKQACKGYRLPTEAEWEYAAGAKQTHAYAGSDDPKEVAWFSESSGGRVHPVGQLNANAWQLRDMSGNVWEWVWDWHAPYKPEERVDPSGPLQGGTYRVNRGGSWGHVSQSVRVANRLWHAPANRSRYQGFRLARSYP